MAGCGLILKPSDGKMCAGHATQMRRHGTVTRLRARQLTVSTFERFIDKAASGCWNWIGTVKEDGYGHFGARKGLAHRRSWRLFRGEIPDGLCVLHRCDNRRCVNPDHLFLGTGAENMEDRDMKGRQSRGERHPDARFTENDVIDIRSLLSMGARQVDLAREFGVSKTAVWSIATRKTWKQVA